MRLEAGAAAAQAGAAGHAARAEAAQLLGLGLGDAAFSLARNATIVQAMSWRIPGWAQRVGQRAAPDEPGQQR